MFGKRGENEIFGQVQGLITCEKWHSHMTFLVLDLSFDIVLGLPWLAATNPCLDWV